MTENPRPSSNQTSNNDKNPVNPIEFLMTKMWSILSSPDFGEFNVFGQVKKLILARLDKYVLSRAIGFLVTIRGPSDLR